MLYLYNENYLTKIVLKNVTHKAKKSSLKVVKTLCERELFSYESRIKYTKDYLDIKTKIPVYINYKILLMPIKSPKRHDTYWINYFEVFSFSKYFNKTIVLFKNLVEIEIDISFNSFSKTIEKAKTINAYFEERLESPIL